MHSQHETKTKTKKRFMGFRMTRYVAHAMRLIYAWRALFTTSLTQRSITITITVPYNTIPPPPTFRPLPTFLFLIPPDPLLWASAIFSGILRRPSSLIAASLIYMGKQDCNNLALCVFCVYVCVYRRKRTALLFICRESNRKIFRGVCPIACMVLCLGKSFLSA